MARKYTSTFQVRCWKEHTCVCCGGAYSYILDRKAVGTGSNADQATKKMQARVSEITARETEMEPCPTCGLYQPDMINYRKAKKRLAILWIATIAIIITLIVRAADGLQANVLTWAAAAICGVAALAHLLIEMHNPNRDPSSNQKAAQQAAAAGKIRFQPGQPSARPDEFAAPSRSIFHLVALVLVLAAIVLAAAPELLRSARKWPLNAECYPPVVGPGDHTRIYMPDSIESVKDYWRGRPNAAIHYNGQTTPLTATTNENTWDSTINVKSEEKKTTSHPYVDITLPASSELAGKTVTCDLDLALEYPQITSGGNTFTVIEGSMHHALTMNLAPEGAGTQYNSVWWGGTSLAAALTALSSLLLYLSARGSAGQSKPTRVFAV